MVNLQKTNGQVLKRVENFILYLILGLTPFLFCNQMTYNFHTPKYLFMQVAVFAAVAIILFKKEIAIRVNLLDALVLLRLLWLIPLVFITSRYAGFFQNADIFAYLVLFYLLIQIVPDEQDSAGIFIVLKNSAGLFTIICTVMAVYGILQYFGLDIFHPGGYQSYESNVAGAFGSANSMGCFLALLLPFVIYSFLTNKKTGLKIILALFIAIVIFTLILTLSRGAWVALIGGLLFLVYPSIRPFIRQKIRRKSVIIGLVILFILIIGAIIVALFFLNADSALGRIFIWKVSGLMIADHPVIGVGYGNYGYQYLNYQQMFFDNPANVIYYDKACNIKLAHSEFIHVMAETGIIGLILLCSLIVLFFKKANDVLKVQRDKEETLLLRVMVASFIIIVIHSLVDSVLHTLPISVMFYFLISLISSISRHSPPPGGLFINREIKPGKTIHRLLIVCGLTLLLFNVYRVIWKGIGYVCWKNGQVAVQNQKWNEGILEYEEAIHYLPKNGELQFHLGAAYAYTGQFEKGLKIIQQSQTTFNDKNIYLVLGQVYLQTDEYQKAEENFKTVTYMYPQLLSPHLLLAQLYRKTGYHSLAVSELEFIIASEPKILSDEVLSIKRDARQYLNYLENPE